MHNVGRLSLRNLILLTSEIEEKWYKLGIALRIPIHVMENFYAKYRKNSMKALNSVYRYWLANGNHLDPTWIKLITGLRKITQYTIASNVEQYINMVSFTIRILLKMFLVNFVEIIRKLESIITNK